MVFAIPGAHGLGDGVPCVMRLRIVQRGGDGVTARADASCGEYVRETLLRYLGWLTQGATPQ